MIAPGESDFAKSRPRARVSSGLCEMCVAMNEKGFDAVFVANAQAEVARNFSDAGHLCVREFLFPGIQEFYGVASREGEDQFEIFTISERGEEWRFGGGFAPGVEFRGFANGNCG